MSQNQTDVSLLRVRAHDFHLRYQRVYRAIHNSPVNLTKWAAPGGHGCDVSRRCELLRFIGNHCELIKTMMRQISYNPDATFRLRHADRGRGTLNDQLWQNRHAVCHELRRRGVEIWSTVIPLENAKSTVVGRTSGAQAHNGSSAQAPKANYPACLVDSEAHEKRHGARRRTGYQGTYYGRNAYISTH